MARPTTAALCDAAQKLADDAKALQSMLRNALCPTAEALATHREAIASLRCAQSAISDAKYSLGEFNQLSDFEGAAR